MVVCDLSEIIINELPNFKDENFRLIVRDIADTSQDYTIKGY